MIETDSNRPLLWWSIYNFHRVAAALVFDISRAATFQSMKKWLNDLREKVTLPDGTDVPVVLLANKCDVSVAVTNEQIAKFCKENRIDAWYATSAKQNTNIGRWTITICRYNNLKKGIRELLFEASFLQTFLRIPKRRIPDKLRIFYIYFSLYIDW